MREMKDSGVEWIGEIPEDWNICLVKNVFNITRGRVIAKTEIEETKTADVYPVYSSQTANNGILGYIPTYDYAVDSLTWTTDGAKAGTVFLRRGKYSITNVCGILTAKKDDCLLEYLYYAVSYSTMNCRRADINGYKIMSNEMAVIPITIPTKEVQKKIVFCLNQKCTQIDTLIQNVQTQIEKLKAYKQSLITEVVTKGLDPTVPMKDSGVSWIGEVASSHTMFRLKYLLASPMQYGANESGDKFTEGAVRYIRITDITAEGKLKDDDANQYLTMSVARDYILKDKDILFARSGGTVGKSFLFYEKYGISAFAGYLIKAECNRAKLLPEYLMYHTQSSLYELWKNMIFIQATIQNIGANKYANMEFPVPSIEAQTSTVSYLDAKCSKIDHLIAIKQAKIEKLEQYKRSLIYEYVTGKKEVI